MSSDTGRSWTTSSWVRLQDPPRDLEMDKAVKEKKNQKHKSAAGSITIIPSFAPEPKLPSDKVKIK